MNAHRQLVLLFLFTLAALVAWSSGWVSTTRAICQEPEVEEESEWREIDAYDPELWIAMAALRKTFQALFDGDLDAYRAGCYTESDAQRTAIELDVAMIASVRRFHDAVVKAYGEKGWYALRNRTDEEDDEEGGTPIVTGKLNATLRVHANLELPNPENFVPLEWLDDDHLAVARQLDSDSRPVVMKRVDGRWLLDVTQLIGPGAQAKALTEIIQKGQAILDRHLIAVGHPGIAIEDIDFEVGREMAGLFFRVKSVESLPHRYDLEKIRQEQAGNNSPWRR